MKQEQLHTSPLVKALNIVKKDYALDTKEETYKRFFKIKKLYKCRTIAATTNWIIRNKQLKEEKRKYNTFEPFDWSKYEGECN